MALNCLDDSDCGAMLYCREGECVSASTCKELAEWGYESGSYWLNPADCTPRPFAKYECNMEDPWTCVSFERSYEGLCGKLEENFFTPMADIETPPIFGLDTTGWTGPYTLHSNNGRQQHSRIYQFRFAPFTEVQFRSLRIQSSSTFGYKSDINVAEFTGDSWAQINNFDGMAGDHGDVIYGYAKDEPGGDYTVLLSFAEEYGQAESFGANEGYTLPITTRTVVGQPSATWFRIAWGETSVDEVEGWYPWYSGEICFR